MSRKRPAKSIINIKHRTDGFLNASMAENWTKICREIDASIRKKGPWASAANPPLINPDGSIDDRLPVTTGWMTTCPECKRLLPSDRFKSFLRKSGIRVYRGKCVDCRSIKRTGV